MAKKKKNKKFNFSLGFSSQSRFSLLLSFVFLLLIFFNGFLAQRFIWPIYFQPIFFAGFLLSLSISFGTKPRDAFALFMIFLLAYSIRCYNIQPRFKYFFAFDSYYHARMVSYLLQHGSVPEYDNLAYYELPLEKRRITFKDGIGFWYIAAFFYKLFTLFGAYNETLFIEFVKIFPAFAGALVSVFMFYLAKEIFGKLAGYAASFASATVPAYVYRTIAGFFEDDSLGFLWLVLGFTAFFRALKEEKIGIKSVGYALLSGFFFAVMAWTWLFYKIIPVLLLLSFPPIFLIYLQNSLSKKDTSKRILSFLAIFLISFSSFAILSYPVQGFKWITPLTGYVVGIFPVNLEFKLNVILGVGVFVFLIAFLLVLIRRSLIVYAKTSPVFWFLGFSFLILVLLASLIMLADPNKMFSQKFMPKSVFMSTVGEESPGKDTFPYKYSIYNLVFILALPAMVFYSYLNRNNYLLPFAFIWLIVAIVMAWFKLKFTYALGLPAALAFSSLVAFFELSSSKFSFSETSKKIITIFMLFILASSIAGSVIFVAHREPSIETDKVAWKKAILWLRDNTPKNSRLMNTWSYGHWITFIAKRSVFADNSNKDWNVSSGEFARFLLSTDTNKALEIIKKYKPNYILLSSNLLVGSSSLLVYAEEKKASEIMSDPKLAMKATLLEGSYYRCKEDENFVICNTPQGKLPIAKKNFLKLKDYWHEKPDETINLRVGTELLTVPAWLYRDTNNIGLAELLSELNKSMLAKLWFNDPELKKYFSVVHIETSGNEVVKVIKVNLSALK